VTRKIKVVLPVHLRWCHASPTCSERQWAAPWAGQRL